jgi:hypothetical protein
MAVTSPIIHLSGDIYEHGEPWWNDIDGKIPDSYTKAVWQSDQQSSSREAGGTGKGNYEFCLTKHLFHISKSSLTCCKSL